MKSIKSVYKIGHGPSSSHTVGPYHAAQIFGARYPEADRFLVTLYGSLAFTGEGHGTGKAIRSGLPGAKILINRTEKNLPHPNTMLFEAYRDGQLLGKNRIFSIGGGSIRIENEASEEELEIYPQENFSQMLQICRDKNISLLEFIGQMEDPSLRDYLKTIWEAMKEAVARGLATEGILPGGLGVARKAKLLYEKRCYNESADVTMNRLLAAYAYACSGCRRPCGQRDPHQRQHLRCRMRVPGGDRKRLLHDGCCCRRAFKAQHRSDRVCCGDCYGAQSGLDLRPGRRSRADSLHRAERRRRHACDQFRHALALSLHDPEDLLR